MALLYSLFLRATVLVLLFLTLSTIGTIRLVETQVSSKDLLGSSLKERARKAGSIILPFHQWVNVEPGK